MPIQKFTDLDVYNIAHELAMEMFKISKQFPGDEKYSLTDQIRRSSRSIAANIAEGWGKRIYPANFKKQLVDANGSLEETKSWLMFARDCEYITSGEFDSYILHSEKAGAKLWKLHDNWH
ncbi:MAG: four helix bundle protein [Chitinophagaceae bacterium]|nr:four helix bundle protein [Chitinophagaceae bacterium]